MHVVGFFFSSRRRHTRCSRDWSSDVCSSDLGVCSIRPPRGTASPLTASAVILTAAYAYSRIKASGDDPLLDHLRRYGRERQEHSSPNPVPQALPTRHPSSSDG